MTWHCFCTRDPPTRIRDGTGAYLVQAPEPSQEMLGEARAVPPAYSPMAKPLPKTATTERGPPKIGTNRLLCTGGTRSVASARGFASPSIEKLKTDSYQSRTRNKLIAEAFYLTRDIEKYGSGYIRVRREIADYPTMEFDYEESGDGFLVRVRYQEQKTITTPKTTPKTNEMMSRVGERVGES